MCVFEYNVLPHVLLCVPSGFILHSSSVLMVKAVIPVINGQWYKIVVRFYELSCKLDAGARKCGHCVWGEWQWLVKWTSEVCPQGPARWQIHKTLSGRPQTLKSDHVHMQIHFFHFVSLFYLSFLQCKRFIVSFHSTYASLKLISRRYIDPSGGAVDLYRWKWLLSKWPQATDWKGKLSWFFNAFVCLFASWHKYIVLVMNAITYYGLGQ